MTDETGRGGTQHHRGEFQYDRRGSPTTPPLPRSRDTRALTARIQTRQTCSFIRDAREAARARYDLALLKTARNARRVRQTRIFSEPDDNHPFTMTTNSAVLSTQIIHASSSLIPLMLSHALWGRLWPPSRFRHPGVRVDSKTYECCTDRNAPTDMPRMRDRSGVHAKNAETQPACPPALRCITNPDIVERRSEDHCPAKWGAEHQCGSPTASRAN